MKNAAAHMLVKGLGVPSQVFELLEGVEEEAERSLAFFPFACFPTLPEGFQSLDHQTGYRHDRKPSTFRTHWFDVPVEETRSDGFRNSTSVRRMAVASFLVVTDLEARSEFSVIRIVGYYIHLCPTCPANE